LSNPVILVAEDSKTDVFLIREALAAAQVEANVHVVTDGDAATKFFDATDADEDLPCPVLVLLDINLPKKSGDEVLQHLRHSRRCRGAQVLVVSSSDAARDRTVLAGLSIAGYFKKPSDYAEFMKLGSWVKSLLAAAKPDRPR
jgi:two-component system, chemotaxis family, response regulator Rcp1